MEKLKKICFHITPIKMGNLKCEYNNDKFCEQNEKDYHWYIGKDEVKETK